MSTPTAPDVRIYSSVVPPQRFVARIENAPTAHNARPSHTNVADDEPVRGSAFASDAAGATVGGGGGGGGGAGGGGGGVAAAGAVVVVVAVPVPTVMNTFP